MNKHMIIISGPTLIKDKELYKGLHINNRVIITNNNFKLEAILKKHTAHCVIFEINNDDPFEIENIKHIKNKFPNLNMILIDGEGKRDFIARAFQMGVNDVFPRPYKYELLLERINAFLKYRAD